MPTRPVAAVLVLLACAAGPLLVRVAAMGNRPATLALLGKAVTNLSAAH